MSLLCNKPCLFKPSSMSEIIFSYILQNQGEFESILYLLNIQSTDQFKIPLICTQVHSTCCISMFMINYFVTSTLLSNTFLNPCSHLVRIIQRRRRSFIKGLWSDLHKYLCRLASILCIIFNEFVLINFLQTTDHAVHAINQKRFKYVDSSLSLNDRGNSSSLLNESFI